LDEKKHPKLDKTEDDKIEYELKTTLYYNDEKDKVYDTRLSLQVRDYPNPV